MEGLDHAVIVSGDLDALSSEFEALGFTLTPPARHPWGTSNRLAQFAGRNFLELLSIDRPELIDAEPSTSRGGPFSFGRHVAHFLANRVGMAMLALRGTDANADLARWEAAGLTTYEPFHFERKATLPDGTAATVAFSLAYATHPDLPELAFFTCHQHSPEVFWKAQYQHHGNRSMELVEVSLAAPEPRRFATFLTGLTGNACRIRDDGIECDIGPHRLIVLDAQRELGGSGTDTVSIGRFTSIGIRVDPDAPQRGTHVRAGGILIHWI